MTGYGLVAVIIQALASLAWPGAVVVCVWFLRDDLKKLLPMLHLRHGDSEVGFKRIGELVSQVQEHEVNEVSAQISQSSRRPTTATADLSGLDSDELRLKVEDIALKMRELEQQFKDEIDLHHLSPSHNWEHSTAKLLESSSQQRKQWQTTLQPTAKALRDELLRRLGSEEKHKLHNTDATFDLGMLAGPYPLNEAALVLEQLARQLSGHVPPVLKSV